MQLKYAWEFNVVESLNFSVMLEVNLLLLNVDAFNTFFHTAISIYYKIMKSLDMHRNLMYWKELKVLCNI